MQTPQTPLPPTTPEPSDDHLLCQTMRGDGDAFGLLMTRHRDYVLNLFLRKGVEYNDAEELAEQVFVRVWRYRKRLCPGGARFTTFLYTIANQVGTDYFRATARRRNLIIAAERVAATGEAPFIARAKPMPRADDESLKVRRAVASLPPAMRDVIELSVFKELAYNEVSSALGIPVGTVKSRMFNALRRLKELLR